MTTPLKPRLNQTDISLLKKTFSTKEDLTNLEQRFKRTFATKQDLERFATKEDLKKLEQRSLATFATQEQLEDTKYELQQQATKYRDELMTRLDKILKEILASRQEQTLNTHKLSNHEDRITTLETASP